MNTLVPVVYYLLTTHQDENDWKSTTERILSDAIGVTGQHEVLMFGQYT